MGSSFVSGSSVFDSLAENPPPPMVEVFDLVEAYGNDKDEGKVDLGIGTYRTEESKPWVLPIVRKLEGVMAADTTLNKEYLPVLGLPEFTQAATRMLLGPQSKALLEGRAVGVQSLSGTGALRVVGEFLSRVLGCTHVYSSDPSWANHAPLFLHSGFTTSSNYNYWNPLTKGFDLPSMLSDLSKAPRNSVIVLQACAHNPTGIDPTEDEWRAVAKVMKDRGLFPLFDAAYQGFASGDLDKDAWVVRFFEEEGFELICCQSFAKNFGLYGERVGNITVITNSPLKIPPILGHFTRIIRVLYSSPPIHGARLVSQVLNDPTFFQEWKDCIQSMALRIKKMRQGLRDRLEKLGGTPSGDWSHVTKQIGMFSYTGLSQGQVDYLRTNYHIYMLKSGRINICGLTEANLDYVAGAINDAVRNA